MKLDPATIDGDVFIKAMEELEKRFFYHVATWFEAVKTRLEDVELLEEKDTTMIFSLAKNDKLSDNRKHKVYLRGERGNWCNCHLGKYGEQRALKVCTHVGAAYLFKFIHKGVPNG